MNVSIMIELLKSEVRRTNGSFMFEPFLLFTSDYMLNDCHKIGSEVKERSQYHISFIVQLKTCMNFS